MSAHMFRRSLISLLAMAAMAAAVSAYSSMAGAAEERLMVIVNADNPVTQLSSVELEKIFLGKRGFWEWGKPVKTVDLIEQGIKEDESSRALFSEDFMGKSLTALKSYWIRSIFSGKGQPPLVFPNAAGVIGYVGENMEAIGYVPRKEALSGKVKVLQVLRDTGTQ